MRECSFCKKTISDGTGKTLAKNDGKIFHFCSSKCEKNLIKLKRNPRTTSWTNQAHDIKKGFKN